MCVCVLVADDAVERERSASGKVTLGYGTATIGEDTAGVDPSDLSALMRRCEAKVVKFNPQEKTWRFIFPAHYHVAKVRFSTVTVSLY